MPHTLVRISFADYMKWRAVFDEAADLRKSFGSKGVHVFRNQDVPNEVVILGEYEDLARAREMFESQEFRAAIQRAGVMGPPKVDYLEDAGMLSA